MLEFILMGWAFAAVYVSIAGAAYVVGTVIALVAAAWLRRRALRDWPRARARARFVRLYCGPGPRMRFRRGPADYRNWSA